MANKCFLVTNLTARGVLGGGSIRIPRELGGKADSQAPEAAFSQGPQRLLRPLEFKE